MKVYLNRKPVQGPWGGGNRLLTALVDALVEEGHEVVYQLQSGIDKIFCFDPRPNDVGEWYPSFLNYRMLHGAEIIQRVGDLGTHGKPELTELVRESITYSDFIIFPSEWAKEWIGFDKDNFDIIHNAPLNDFHKYKKNKDLGEKINLTTHHWSTNPKKGFAFYEQVDDYVGKNPKFSFSYMGRLPDGFRFRNSEYLPAIGDINSMAEILSNSDIYVTASEEEAGANHVLEALASGLPILYHDNGGSILNYCDNYGVGYGSFDNFVNALDKMVNNFSFYKNKALSFDKNIKDVVEQYREVICNTKST